MIIKKRIEPKNPAYKRITRPIISDCNVPFQIGKNIETEPTTIKRYNQTSYFSLKSEFFLNDCSRYIKNKANIKTVPVVNASLPINRMCTGKNMLIVDK